MNRQAWLALLVFTAAGALAAGCSGSGAPSAAASIDPEWNGTITVVTNRTDLIDTKYKEYADAFQALHPGITVQFEALRDYDKNIKIRLASGETPDVLLIPTIPNADLHKFFLPLNDIGIDLERVYFAEMKTYMGINYGLPSGISVSGVAYNKPLFRKAGITAPPRTLDEFLADCAKLKAAGAVPLASNFKDRWPLQVWTNDVPQILSESGAVLNDMAEVDEPFTSDAPIVRSMDIVKTMYERGYLEPSLNDTNWEGSKRDVAEGRTGMVLSGIWLVNQLVENGARSEDIGYFPFPADNSGVPRASLSPDRYYAVGKNTKHAAAAKAFVRWMVEASNYDNESGFLPVLKDRSSTLPQLQELESYGPRYIELDRVQSDSLSLMLNKAQIELPGLVQEYMLGDSAGVLAKYNKLWRETRKQLGLAGSGTGDGGTK